MFRHILRVIPTARVVVQRINISDFNHIALLYIVYRIHNISHKLITLSVFNIRNLIAFDVNIYIYIANSLCVNLAFLQETRFFIKHRSTKIRRFKRLSLFVKKLILIKRNILIKYTFIYIYT